MVEAQKDINKVNNRAVKSYTQGIAKVARVIPEAMDNTGRDSYAQGIVKVVRGIMTAR